jgi:hypothetical protein
MENYTNSEMTDVVLCTSYREKIPARRVPHSQTFVVVVYGKMVLFDCIRQQEFCE